jgi:hypothetical protein
VKRLAYPPAVLVADYLRAAAGLVPCAAILLTIRLGVTATAVLSGLAALFFVFGIRTALRHATRVELSETAVRSSGPFAAAIVWSEFDGLKLGYYATRRDRTSGWLQLELRAGSAVLRLDSRIEGFDLLVARAAAAAAARGLPLDRATAANLSALGIDRPAAAPAVRETCGVEA